MQYIVHRGGNDSASTNVIYNPDDQKTWPMPGDTVDAVHTLYNAENDVPYSIAQDVYVPVATINGNPVTTTGLSGTTGNTNIFNEAKNGAAISTATFTFPQTNLVERNADMKYTYTLSAGLEVDSHSKIDDVLVVGAPFMTQYTYTNEVKIAALPAITGATNTIVQKGTGAFDLLDGVSSTTFEGTAIDSSAITIRDEYGSELTEISTMDEGTYVLTYTVTDANLQSGYNATTVTRTVTVVDGEIADSKQYAISAESFSIYLTDAKSFNKTELIERSGAVGYKSDGTSTSETTRFTVANVDGTETSSLEAITGATGADVVPVIFYYRTGNAENDQATITIYVTIVDNNAAVSPNNKNTVNAKNVVIKSSDAIDALTGDVDSGLNTFPSFPVVTVSTRASSLTRRISNVTPGMVSA